MTNKSIDLKKASRVNFIGGNLLLCEVEWTNIKKCSRHLFLIDLIIMGD